VWTKSSLGCFFWVGGWEFLLSTAWRQGKLQNGDAPMFGSIEALVSFSSVWYVCVIVWRRMMVWQRSCQVRCTQRKSRGAVVEGFATKKISSADFCFSLEEEVGGWGF
jgi:hypothetical protein